MRRRVWVPDVSTQGAARLRTPARDGVSDWAGALGLAAEDDRSPHRRGSEKQLDRQPGLGEPEGAPHDTRSGVGSGLYRRGVVSVVRIEEGYDEEVGSQGATGPIPVYDLSVEEDESFAVSGIIAHNCSSPNLHNQPSRGGDDAKMIKDCFIAQPGYALLQFDFSTLEIRIAAALSGDPVMIQTIKDNPDFHLATAMAIAPTVWGISAEQVLAEFLAGDKTKRSIAKTINFGTLYGQSPYALAAQIEAITGKPFSADDAQKAQDAILGRYRVLREWISDQKRRASKTGEAWTFWDGAPARRRPLYDIGYNSPKRSGTHMRSSFNTPIQGTGSDFCLMSLIAAEEYCRTHYGRDCFPVMTVHDSILFEVKKDPLLLDDVVYQIYRIMTGWYAWGVPLLVDVEGGPSWGSLKKLVIDAESGLLIDDRGICD